MDNEKIVITTKTGFEDLLRGEQSGKSTEILRKASALIVQSPDYGQRKKLTEDLVTALDANALIQIFEKIGIDATHDHVQRYIRDSVGDALSNFREQMTAQESAVAREGKRQPKVKERILEYWDKEIEGTVTRDVILEVIRKIKDNLSVYLSATVDAFDGDYTSLQSLTRAEQGITEFFLAIVFGAHARWVAGQIERTRNEAPDSGWVGEKDTPIHRPIYRDLRDLRAGKRREMELAHVEEKKFQIDENEVTAKTMNALKQDWDAATERIVAELTTEIENFHREYRN